MPFRKVGDDDYVSPSGRHFTAAQVRMYYAGGFKKRKRKRRKKAMPHGADALDVLLSRDRHARRFFLKALRQAKRAGARAAAEAERAKFDAMLQRFKALKELNGTGALFKAAWDESKHPRDHGKFSHGAGAKGADAVPRGTDDHPADAKARSLLKRLSEVPAALKEKVSAFVAAKYAGMVAKYGETGAKAVLAATVLLLPVPLPGTTLIPVALAEAVLRVRRAVAGVAKAIVPELSDAEVLAAARAFLADLYAECGEELPDLDDADTEVLKAFDPNEPRDESGKWTTGGGATIIGRGSSGEVLRHGEEVAKPSVRSEGKVYQALSGVEGVAAGREESGKVVTPHFPNVVSVDTVPDGKRQSYGAVIKPNLPRLVNAITALSEAGYDYNDPIQVGFDKGRKAHLFDFSASEPTTPEEATRENLSRLSQYLRQFGLGRHADGISRVGAVLGYMDPDSRALVGDDDPDAADAARVSENLDGQPVRYAYYAFNARTIPGVSQTEHRDGIKAVFTSEPLSNEFLSQWELMPALHRTDAETIEKAFREEDHPRGDDGRFINGHDLQIAKHSPAKASELRERVTNPVERAKLEAHIGDEEGRRGPAVSQHLLGQYSDPAELAAFHNHLAKYKPGSKEYEEAHKHLSGFLTMLLDERAGQNRNLADFYAGQKPAGGEPAPKPKPVETSSAQTPTESAAPSPAMTAAAAPAPRSDAKEAERRATEAPGKPATGETPDQARKRGREARGRQRAEQVESRKRAHAKKMEAAGLGQPPTLVASGSLADIAAAVGEAIPPSRRNNPSDVVNAFVNSFVGSGGNVRELATSLGIPDSPDYTDQYLANIVSSRMQRRLRDSASESAPKKPAPATPLTPAGIASAQSAERAAGPVSAAAGALASAPQISANRREAQKKTEAEVEAAIERDKREPAKTPAEAVERANAILEGLRTTHNDAELIALAKRVTGRGGRTAKQALDYLRQDMTAVSRMLDAQRV